MIVVDMNMPTDCVDCPIDCFPYGAEDTDYSTTNRPNCCPIKCDIEDIKAEIDSHCSENRDRNDGLYIAMKIIDKHITGVSE